MPTLSAAYLKQRHDDALQKGFTPSADKAAAAQTAAIAEIAAATAKIAALAATHVAPAQKTTTSSNTC